jgi:hypothetical protein
MDFQRQRTTGAETMTDIAKLPPLPPGASLTPRSSELPPLPAGASYTQAEAPTPENVYVDPFTGMQLSGPSIFGETEEPTGGAKLAQQAMLGLTAMPMRFMASLAKPVLGGAQLIAKQFEAPPQQTMEGLIAGKKPTKPLSWIDEAIDAVNQIERGSNEAAGPLSWLTTRPASLAGDLYSGFGAGKTAYNVASRLLPNAPRVASTAVGTLGGGTSALLQPTEPGLYGSEFNLEKAKQAGVGSVAGGTLGSIFGSLASKDIDRLRKAGVTDLTPGMLSPTMRNMEDFAQKYLPFVSGKIGEAEANALQSFNRAAAQTVLQPLGVTIPSGIKPGYELNKFVKDEIGKRYTAIENKIHLPFTIKEEDAIRDEMSRLTRDMSQKSAKLFTEEVMSSLKNAVTSIGIPGKNFREMESSLGTKAMDYVSSKEAVDRSAGRAIFQFQDFLRQQLRDANPSVAKELTAIHTSFRNSLPYRKASTYAEAIEGVINPGMLRRSTKNLEGMDVPLRDLADASVNVMGKKVVSPQGSASSRGLGAAAGVLPFVASSVPAAAPYTVPGLEFLVPAAIGTTRALYSRPGIAASNLISATPGGVLGTSAGAPAGALTSFREDMERRKAEQGLLPR